MATVSKKKSWDRKQNENRKELKLVLWHTKNNKTMETFKNDTLREDEMKLFGEIIRRNWTLCYDTRQNEIVESIKSNNCVRRQN